MEEIFYYLPKEIPGVDLNPAGQLELFSKLKSYHDEQPFTAQRSAPRRFHFENPAYSYLDALVLYAMIRHLRPKRIIEAGSGYSSGVILDTSELFFENSIECTFIEPHPELLKSLMKDGDLQRAELIQARLQDVPLEKFQHLEAGDIVFVDSSHVSKVDSDVNYCLFKLLPQLKSGVYVHFHDVFYPFEYPAEWIQ
jgi:predicted O-methyltransferase YrrM